MRILETRITSASYGKLSTEAGISLPCNFPSLLPKLKFNYIYSYIDRYILILGINIQFPK